MQLASRNGVWRELGHVSFERKHRISSRLLFGPKRVYFFSSPDKVYSGRGW